MLISQTFATYKCWHPFFISNQLKSKYLFQSTHNKTQVHKIYIELDIFRGQKEEKSYCRKNEETRPLASKHLIQTFNIFFLQRIVSGTAACLAWIPGLQTAQVKILNFYIPPWIRFSSRQNIVGIGYFQIIIFCSQSSNNPPPLLFLFNDPIFFFSSENVRVFVYMCFRYIWACVYVCVQMCFIYICVCVDVFYIYVCVCVFVCRCVLDICV